MELNPKTMKKLALLIAFGIILFLGLSNLNPILAFVGVLFRLLFPFLLGLCIAFVLNVPMRFLEKLIFGAPDAPQGKIKAKIRRPLSLLLTLVLVLGIIVVVMFLVIPELGRTLASLANQIPVFVSSLQSWLNGLADKYPDIYAQLNSLEINWQDIGTKLAAFLQDKAGDMVNFTMGAVTNAVSSIVAALTNFFLGSVFAIYVLMQKEKLGHQLTKLLNAYLPKRTKRITEVCSLAHKTFSSFLSGQCLEAIILGTILFLTMSLFRFPYALLISVLTAFTALIPIFGAIIAWVVGGFLILLVNPMQALWFIILFQVVQQIEGNLIYPHVVGNSVGLPSIWVLAAVTIGGSLMGIPGMLFFIPLCSVLYALLRESTNRRLCRKQAIPALPDKEPEPPIPPEPT